MRESIFRAWDKKSNRWVTADLKDFIVCGWSGKQDEPSNLCIGQKGCPHNAINFIFQQYTGIKDKLGKEIYEGDIVALAGYGDYLVEFPFMQLYESSFEGDIKDIKGNIYENPELLKEKY